ncbi:MAG: 4-hydroxy-tetrahydrodipicolinate reductase [Treponema sp.]|jgi:4-hydroxy-tetrahydrodipicolinate reductase|nr:4-hydroxy-tetrahydrodipicolinate reductase [Treponema sp.]
MNIALIGFGRMGKMIEAAARERGHRIAAVVDPYGPDGAAPGTALYKTIEEAEPLGGADLAVEFTRPETAAENIKALAKRGIPAVTGTTGWYGRLEEVKQAVEASGSSLLWSSNFSLGVHFFYRIAAFAAALADAVPEYDAGGWEAHHNKKADSPSGTARILAEKVLARMKRKTRAVFETLNRPPAAEEFHYPSLRIGSAPGIHTLIFDSPADTIEITHTARNREGFALGAVRAAEWLVSCSGPGKPAGARRRGIFTMDDVLAGLWPDQP